MRTLWNQIVGEPRGTYKRGTERPKQLETLERAPGIMLEKTRLSLLPAPAVTLPLVAS
jgi:hypothetical protein